MKETTRIATVRITGIARGREMSFSKEESKRRLAESIRRHIDCDDVVVDEIQDFVMNKEETPVEVPNE